MSNPTLEEMIDQRAYVNTLRADLKRGYAIVDGERCQINGAMLIGIIEGEERKLGHMLADCRHDILAEVAKQLESK